MFPVGDVPYFEYVVVRIFLVKDVLVLRVYCCEDVHGQGYFYASSMLWMFPKRNWYWGCS